MLKLVKKILGVWIIVLSLIVLLSCTAKEGKFRSQYDSDNLTPGKVYVETDQTHGRLYRYLSKSGVYISYYDEGVRYQNQEQLNQATRKNEARVFPYREYSIGHYKKVKSDYQVTVTTTITLYFSDIKSYKNRSYWDIKKKSNQQDIYWIKQGRKGYKINQSQVQFKVVDKRLPENEEEFLKEYHKDGEEE